MSSRSKKWTVQLLTAVIAFALCGGPEWAQAQQSPSPATNPPETTQAPAPDQQQDQQPAPDAAPEGGAAQQPSSRPGVVDPSQGPLNPAPAPDTGTLPEAPSASSQPATTPEAVPQQSRPRSSQPVGVGTAQQAPTAGGAASKPAGNAIAPAKQRQYRSLLIKLGAIAGAGVALGTVLALSKGTKSTPPGSGR